MNDEIHINKLLKLDHNRINLRSYLIIPFTSY